MMIPIRSRPFRPFTNPMTKSWLICVLAILSCRLYAQQTEDPDRPRLNHESQPIPQNDPSIEPLKTEPGDEASGTPIGDGLVLSRTGHVWARDTFDGKPRLVQLKYLPAGIDAHAASNAVKGNLAPFIYKPKESVEIGGAAATIRLRDPNASIYVRGFGAGAEDAAPSSGTSTQSELAVVRVESKKDRRIISTIAFTQITGKASRNSQTVDISTEKVGKSDWQKITPKEPLAPGEYALLYLPRGQNLFPAQIFDFAIDPKAPPSPDAVVPVTEDQHR